MKACNKCHEVKPLDEFRTQKRGEKVYYRGDCRTCEANYNKAYHLNGGRDIDLKYRYGITAAQYDEMLEAQNGGCAVCGTTEPGHKNKYFCVDHDHGCCPTNNKTCGKCVRGLLCHSCNVILGHAKDDADRLVGLAAYLINTKEVSHGNQRI